MSGPMWNEMGYSSFQAIQYHISGYFRCIFDFYAVRICLNKCRMKLSCLVDTLWWRRRCVCRGLAGVCRATVRRCSVRARRRNTPSTRPWPRSARRPTSRRSCTCRRTPSSSPTRTASSSTPSSASASSRR